MLREVHVFFLLCHFPILFMPTTDFHQRIFLKYMLSPWVMYSILLRFIQQCLLCAQYNGLCSWKDKIKILPHQESKMNIQLDCRKEYKWIFAEVQTEWLYLHSSSIYCPLPSTPALCNQLTHCVPQPIGSWNYLHQLINLFLSYFKICSLLCSEVSHSALLWLSLLHPTPVKPSSSSQSDLQLFSSSDHHQRPEGYLYFPLPHMMTSQWDLIAKNSS